MNRFGKQRLIVKEELGDIEGKKGDHSLYNSVMSGIRKGWEVGRRGLSGQRVLD